MAFRDAPPWSRCSAAIKLHDGSIAQCGRWISEGTRQRSDNGAYLCSQHFNMFITKGVRKFLVGYPLCWRFSKAAGRQMTKSWTCSRCGSSYNLGASPSCPECGAEPCPAVGPRRPKHVAYVERRMERGDYAQEVGRDLWALLNAALDAPVRYGIASDEVDDQLAAYYARCLVYLARTYNSKTETDPYQGRMPR